ncbi:MAG: hypothetical protein Rubg2KO_40920 [Rubricoccaceae bacterium]
MTVLSTTTDPAAWVPEVVVSASVPETAASGLGSPAVVSGSAVPAPEAGASGLVWSVDVSVSAISVPELEVSPETSSSASPLVGLQPAEKRSAPTTTVNHLALSITHPPCPLG